MMFQPSGLGIKYKAYLIHVAKEINRPAHVRRFLNLPAQKQNSINGVTVSKIQHTPTVLPSLSDSTKLVDSLLAYTSTLVDASASNIIAFSGGVDSSLAAALVYRTFHGVNDRGNVLAVLGVSPSLPESQLILARSIASSIGIDLKEVPTSEGFDSTYIENQGQACFVCKSHLYSSLDAVAATASSIATSPEHEKNVIMYNGTNADDTKDPTRLGLIAAKSFSVQSPLIHTTKDNVRRAAKHMNLPNWNYAASPCLRSRLALGVAATSEHLQAVSRAEDRVRRVLSLDETINMRVRMFSGKKAVLELDEDWLTLYNKENGSKVEVCLRLAGVEDYLKELGFIGGFRVRAFKSGSVSRVVI